MGKFVSSRRWFCRVVWPVAFVKFWFSGKTSQLRMLPGWRWMIFGPGTQIFSLRTSCFSREGEMSCGDFNTSAAAAGLLAPMRDGKLFRFPFGLEFVMEFVSFYLLVC
ncbi:Os07g0266700 [Oryza sativa Japonica Group]|uniref:Os07g0266700 protein n=1 Tax=Oryza sativa subsp. japonica TaxID=39947 RepID=Q6YS96_ORYSJ|nr:unknown protein [Oryza sativa Japonica Group]BAF21250.1 Os07g0266700 [Oryza sativa Japonica Group]|eukprot:NP_001059336.1 Os07g0266700 [Oryza sativa Japonica Group]